MEEDSKIFKPTQKVENKSSALRGGVLHFLSECVFSELTLTLRHILMKRQIQESAFFPNISVVGIFLNQVFSEMPRQLKKLFNFYDLFTNISFCENAKPQERETLKPNYAKIFSPYFNATNFKS